MMCGLLADTLANEMVGLVDKAIIDKSIGFLVEWLATGQLYALGEECQAVSVLADTIL